MITQKICKKCENKFKVYDWSEGKEKILCLTDKIIDDMFDIFSYVMSKKTRGHRKLTFSWKYTK